MDEQRRRQLELKLQAILGELTTVCAELGIDALSGAAPRPAEQPTAAAPALANEGRALAGLGPLLLARLDRLLTGFVAREVLELVRMVALSDPVEPRRELAGFVNVRGQAVPVIDLRCLLELPPVEADPEQALVILQAERGRVAVIVDEVLDIYELGPENFQHRDSLELRRGFIDGVARVNDRLVAVINPVLLARTAL